MSNNCNKNKRSTKDKRKAVRQRWSKRVVKKQNVKKSAGRTHTEKYAKIKQPVVQVAEVLSQNVEVKRKEPDHGMLFNFASKLAVYISYPVSTAAKIVLKVLKPSQSRKRKYEELEERICELEKEVQQIKKKKCFHEQTTKINQAPVCTSLYIAPLQMPPPLPPPPPPPPPPAVKSCFTRTIKKKNVPDRQKEKVNHQITDELLKTVTLKKVTKTLEAYESSNKENVHLNAPLVSLSDIRNIKLKKSIVQNRTPTSKSALKPRNTGSIQKSSSGKKRTPENVFRRHLRKCNISRSPGGTPLTRTKDFSVSMGEGLTPMLSNALKKKFNNAIPEKITPNSCTDTSTPALQFEISP